MPAKNLMTWDPRTRRWRKLHAGRRHVVSCAQLGAPATKEASVAAANRWWQDRLAAIEAEARPPRREH